MRYNVANISECAFKTMITTDGVHGNLPLGNQELLVVRNKVGTPQVSFSKQVDEM